jgi:flagellar motor switch protein FliN/FliY
MDHMSDQPTTPETAPAQPSGQARPATAPNPSGEAPSSPAEPRAARTDQLGRLAEVTLDVSVELGRASLPVRELLALDEGGVIRLDHPLGEPVDLLVNGLRTARGEVVVVDGRLGLRITELVES